MYAFILYNNFVIHERAQLTSFYFQLQLVGMHYYHHLKASFKNLTAEEEYAYPDIISRLIFSTFIGFLLTTHQLPTNYQFQMIKILFSKLIENHLFNITTKRLFILSAQCGCYTKQNIIYVLYKSLENGPVYNARHLASLRRHQLYLIELVT